MTADPIIEIGVGTAPTRLGRRRRPDLPGVASVWLRATPMTAFWVVIVAILVLPIALFLSVAISPRLFDQGTAWFTLSGFRQAFSGAFLRGVLDSLFVGVASAVAAAVLGFAVAWAVLRTDLPGRRLWTASMFALLLAPSYLIALGWERLLEPAGVLDVWGLHPGIVRGPFYGPLGVIIVLTVKGLPFAYIAMSSALRGLGEEFEAAVRVHGGSATAALRTVVSLLAPAVWSALAIVFAESVSDFGVAATLANDAHFPVATFTLYNAVESFPIQFPVAAAVGWVLMAMAGLALFAQSRALRGRSYRVLGGRTRPARRHRLCLRTKAAGLVAMTMLVVVGLGVPVFGAVSASLINGLGSLVGGHGFTLDNYRRVVSNASLRAPLLYSAKLATVTATAGVALAAVAARLLTRRGGRLGARTLDLMLLTAVALPGIVFAAGYIFTYNLRFVNRLGIHLYETTTLLVIAVSRHGAAEHVASACRQRRAAPGVVAGGVARARRRRSPIVAAYGAATARAPVRSRVGDHVRRNAARAAGFTTPLPAESAAGVGGNHQGTRELRLRRRHCDGGARSALRARGHRSRVGRVPTPDASRMASYRSRQGGVIQLDEPMLGISEGHRICIRGVTKRFGAVTALDRVDLDVAPGRFLVLLGPSGSGKTTLLRILAGIERTDGGSIHFHNRQIVGGTRVVAPEHRDLAMVFQDYALWPHLSALGNVAYALRRRRLSRDETRRRTSDAIERVGLAQFCDRYPHELSGGQQQRVALARAVVARPRLLLFDEPLSNLDADLRERMRVEIATLTRESGATAVYITHDQSEAFALGDKVAVLNEGRVEQVGAPEEIYRRPASPFVTRFTGLAGEAQGRVIEITGERAAVAVGAALLECRLVGGARRGGAVTVLVRPAATSLAALDDIDGPGGMPGTVVDVAYRGRGYDHVVDCGVCVLTGVFDPRPWPRGNGCVVRIDPEGCAAYEHEKPFGYDPDLTTVSLADAVSGGGA